MKRFAGPRVKVDNYYRYVYNLINIKMRRGRGVVENTLKRGIGAEKS